MAKKNIKKALAAAHSGVTITSRVDGVQCGGAFDVRRTAIEITGMKVPVRDEKGRDIGWINRYEIVDGAIKFEAVIMDTDIARKIMSLGGLIGKTGTSMSCSVRRRKR
jgi:hypothetical protein